MTTTPDSSRGVESRPADDPPKVLDPNELALALAEVRQDGSRLSARWVYDSHERLRALVGGRSAAPTPDPRPWSPLVEDFRSALMREHADDWDMETVAEAAYICAEVVTGPTTRRAIYDAVADRLEWGDKPWAVAEYNAIADAVVALLSRSAAEPPAESSVGVSPLRLRQLAELVDDWDSYGGKPPTEQAMAVARSLNTVPRSDGGLQLVWHVNGWDIEVEFEPDGQPSFWAHHRESGQQLTDGAVAAEPNEEAGDG